MKDNRTCQENTPVIENTIFQQLYTCTSPDGQHQKRLIVLFAARGGSSIQSARIRPGVDCGLYHELLIAKF